MKLTALPAALLLAAVAGTASAAPADMTAAPLATLEKANTVQVTETILADPDTGALKPEVTLNVSLSKPGMARLEECRPGATAPYMILMADGKSMVQYQPAKKQYQKSASKMTGFGPEKLPSLASYPAGTPATTTTLDGKPALLYKITTQGEDGPTTQQLWVNPTTHLPQQQSTMTGTGDAAKEVERIVFSGWSLDKPIAPTQFAFAPPAGVTLLVPKPEPKLLANGVAAPDFTAIDKDGKSVKLSDFKGKVVVIDFWASWCPPCRASMPHNQEVAKKFQDAGTPFVLLAVDNSEDRDAFSTWVAKNGPDMSALTFVHIPTATSVANNLYHVTGIPTQYVIDPAGKISQSFVGYGGPSDDLANAVKAAGAS